MSPDAHVKQMLNGHLNKRDEMENKPHPMPINDDHNKQDESKSLHRRCMCGVCITF